MTGRIQWGERCLKAMAALGETSNALYAYAKTNGLLKSANVIRLIANRYTEEGLLRQAMDLLQDNLSAVEFHKMTSSTGMPPRIVDRLIEIAHKICTKTELTELFNNLLHLEPNQTIHNKDLTNWFDELHQCVGDSSWAGVRTKLFDELPSTTVNICLAHEGSLDELYNHIMANGGTDLMRFEELLSKKYPEPYIDLHIKNALEYMNRANDRGAYRWVAAELSSASYLPGGKDRALDAALSIKAEYPRRPALHQELRSAGFDV